MQVMIIYKVEDDSFKTLANADKQMTMGIIAYARRRLNQSQLWVLLLQHEYNYRSWRFKTKNKLDWVNSERIKSLE